jgi:hypothetical protein
VTGIPSRYRFRSRHRARRGRGDGPFAPWTGIGACRTLRPGIGERPGLHFRHALDAQDRCSHFRWRCSRDERRGVGHDQACSRSRDPRHRSRRRLRRTHRWRLPGLDQSARRRRSRPGRRPRLARGHGRHLPRLVAVPTVSRARGPCPGVRTPERRGCRRPRCHRRQRFLDRSAPPRERVWCSRGRHPGLDRQRHRRKHGRHRRRHGTQHDHRSLRPGIGHGPFSPPCVRPRGHGTEIRISRHGIGRSSDRGRCAAPRTAPRRSGDTRPARRPAEAQFLHRPQQAPRSDHQG